MEKWKVIQISFFFLSLTYAQENAQKRLPKSLIECYKTEYMATRDNLLPMTTDVLIDLIRKIENDPKYNQDIRTLPRALLYRFRQDGILRSGNIKDADSILPFSPKGFHFSKHSLILSRLLEGNAIGFPNDTLTTIERCTLHLMLSSTIETQIRGDESIVCNQMAKYRAMRIPRSLNQTPKKDRERLRGPISSRFEIDEPADNEEDTYASRRAGSEFPKEVGFIDTDSTSSCPIESGVIHTPWGAVSGGNLFAGLATSIQPQSIPLKTLLELDPKHSASRAVQQKAKVVNTWAATFAGDLAEAAVRQAPFYSQTSIGAPGAWNSSFLPRYYFLQQKEQFEVTDAEIRGSLDGLIIGTKINKWLSQFNTLKLSQLLDMYYSPFGVLNSNVRACDRRNFFAEVAPIKDLQNQTSSFAALLDKELTSGYTVNYDYLDKYCELAANTLSTYVPQYLNDPSCNTTQWETKEAAEVNVASDLHVFIDSSLPYKDISEHIGFLVKNINISPYGSNVSVSNSKDCQVVVNTTNSLSDFYQNWNSTVHSRQPNGLNLPSVLQNLRNVSLNLLANEKSAKLPSGRSLIALIITGDSTVDGGSSQTSEELVRIIHEENPDLEILFLAKGTVDRFKRFVKDNTDLFQLNVNGGSEGPAQNMKSLVQRIKQLPRRLTNPNCGPSWQSDTQDDFKMDAYVNPGSVNYYRMQPNYFYGDDDNRVLQIHRGSSTQLTICHSRSFEALLSLKNATDTEVLCDKGEKNPVEIKLSSYCSDDSFIHDCKPLYLSVRAEPKKDSDQLNCRDSACRYPNTLKFTIEAKSLGCYSDARCLLGSAGMVLICVLLRWLLPTSS